MGNNQRKPDKQISQQPAEVDVDREKLEKCFQVGVDCVCFKMLAICIA